MIGKISKGSSFRGGLAYVLNEEKGHLINTNMHCKQDVISFSKTLASINDLNKNVKKPVFHVSISLEKNTVIDDEKFSIIGERYMEKFGFYSYSDPNSHDKKMGATSFVMARHTDTEHPHIHIIANRINSRGYCHNPGNDFKLSNTICRELEKEFGFNIISNVSPAIKKEKPKEIKMRQRLKEEGRFTINYRRDIRISIDRALQAINNEKRSYKDFVYALKKEGVDIRLNTDAQKTRVNGISFSMEYKGEKVKYKGSAIGKAYTWASISNKLYFDINKDIHSTPTAATPVHSNRISDNDNTSNTVNRDNEAKQLVHNNGGGTVSQKGGAGEYREENKSKKRRRYKM